jgi:hypothetical protein
MNENSLLYRTLQCWNQPIEVKAGKFAHLSARAKWIDGRCIIIATEVRAAMVVELPEVACEFDLDRDGGGWITIIVPGPCVIPARARISMQIRCETAMPQWLAELSDSQRAIAVGLTEEGML